MKGFLSFKGIEKLSYLVMIPSILGYGGYAIYKKNFMEYEKRGMYIKKVEDKYLPDNRHNMIKL